MGCLYRIDFQSGKSYIGITAGSAEQRFAAHIKKARNGSPCAVHNALRKYCPSSAKVTTLVIADDWSYLCELETKAIIAFGTKAPNGYNLTDGGDGVIGHSHTAEQRAKISAASMAIPKASRDRAGEKLRGKPLSEERRAKLLAANKDRINSDEARAKMSAAHLGKKLSCEHRGKIGLAHKGRIFTSEHKARLAKAASSMSLEHRAKLSEAKRAWWAKKLGKQ